MPSNATLRSNVRKEIALGLAAKLVGTGLPCQAVYGYRVFDFQGLSPVVVIAPSGVNRVQNAMGSTNRHVTMFFDLFVFARVSDTGVGVDEEDSEDQMDTIEKAIADWVQDNVQHLSPTTSGGWWNTLETADAAKDDTISDGPNNIGGVTYKRLIVPLKVTQTDG